MSLKSHMFVDVNNNKYINQKTFIMNTLRNRVQLIGNLGQDPEIKTLESGKQVVNFTLATHEDYKNADGQKVSEATWHNIVAWNGIAKIAAQYLKKGSEVVVEGRLSYRTYTDKNGMTKYVTEIILTDILLLRSSKIQRADS